MQTIKNPNIVIVDYGIGNLHSVEKACEEVGMQVRITNNKNEIENCDALILPGVGAFGDAMKNLQELNLIDPIKELASIGKPILGVCLGMQLLMTESEEFGLQKGLNLIQGKCKKFPITSNNYDKIKVPQIMWNKIYTKKSNQFDPTSPLFNIEQNSFMYFVHSYYVVPENEEDTLCYSSYCGIEYSSAVKKNNIFAFQFHPEKSGKTGLDIYKNFKKIINNGRE